MEVSWGLIILLVLILFPGLIIRRLFYYGEFSKQFGAGLGLVRLLAVVLIRGVINLFLIFYVYDSFIADIDLGAVVDIVKDTINPNFKWKNTPGVPIKSVIVTDVFPFLGFLYFSSFLIGLLGGRLVRITRIDTKFKILRFKNYWFYLFNGEHTKFKKLRHLQEKNKKHLFTKADILIDTADGTQLYSGIVVDYELEENDCQSLSKVMLQNAERYSSREKRRVRVNIPGNLLVVDCSNLKNINLTFVYEKTESFIRSNVPAIIYNIFSLINLLLIPFFIFRIEMIDLELYLDYYSYPWYKKIVAYILIIQLFGLLNPFVNNKNKEEYEYVSKWSIVAKILIIGIIYVFLYNL